MKALKALIFILVLLQRPFHFDCPGMPNQCGNDCTDKLSDKTQR